MTAAQIAHFFILIGLGILAFLTFVVAGTILGLMMVEDGGCNCVQYPIGLYVLGIFWILLLWTLIQELIAAPVFTVAWINGHREVLILALIILLALIFIL